eukprot:8328235-Lingulodinium_polyedra.AAC.1
MGRFSDKTVIVANKHFVPACVSHGHVVLLVRTRRMAQPSPEWRSLLVAGKPRRCPLFFGVTCRCLLLCDMSDAKAFILSDMSGASAGC